MQKKINIFQNQIQQVEAQLSTGIKQLKKEIHEMGMIK